MNGFISEDNDTSYGYILTVRIICKDRLKISEDIQNVCKFNYEMLGC
jgi:hypothetical protein